MADHILVPLDLSPCAADVVRHAASLARKLNAQVTLMHVVEIPWGVDEEDELSPPGGQPVKVGDFLERDAQAHMIELTELARSEGLEPAVRMAKGRASQAILETADLTKATMIVMGTHGRRGIARLALGSIAGTVSRHARIPVVTVPTVHEADCEARNCAWCDAHLTDAVRLVEVERSG